MINQLEDDGAVIGYKPTLEYNKKSNNNNTSEKEEQSSSSDTDYSGNITYSQTLTNFKNNLPSTALSNLDFAIESMKSLIDTLSHSFKKGNWGEYSNISSLINAVDNNNKEYIDAFINAHKYNIGGSIIPELIGNIYDSKERLEALQAILKELYYGDENLPTEKAIEYDNVHVHRLEKYEQSDSSKINYLAIMYDARLNRSVSIHAFDTNDKAISLSDIIYSNDNSKGNASQYSLVKKLYDEVNDEIDYRSASYDNQQSIEIMKKTLYNYYSKRQEIMDLYDLFNDNPESVFIGNKIGEYKTAMNDAVKSINSTFIGHQFHLGEISNLEEEKYHLMNIYASFSGNLLK